MPLPLAKDRKYAHIASYKELSIATYLSSEPVYFVGSCPVYCVYYVLDDLGDPLLPVDLPVWTPFIACSLIDIYTSLTDADRASWWKQQGPWKLLHQNYRMQQFLPGIAEALRKLHVEAQDKSVDAFYDTPSEFARAMADHLAPIFAAIDGAGPVPPHMQILYNDQENTDDLGF